jgi:hypothetical protein
MQRKFLIQVFALKKEGSEQYRSVIFPADRPLEALSFVKNGLNMKPRSSKSSNESCTVERMLRKFSRRLNPLKAGWENWSLQMRKPHRWAGVRNFWAISYL